MEKTPVFYLPEGFADWEGAFLMPELREAKRPFRIVSENGKSVTSIGGLKVDISESLDSVAAENTEAFILIGSDTWNDPAKNEKALGLAREFLGKGIIVAGICAATSAFARIGLLEGRKHTSNSLGFLKYFVKSYTAEKDYLDQLVVVDRNLITASGVGAIDFTYELLNALNVYSDEKRKQWFALNKHGVKPPPEFWS